MPSGPMTPMPKVPPPWVPGSPLSPSSTPGAEAPGAAQWQVWWNFNQDPYLRLRERLAGLSATSGEGEAGSRPTRAQIENVVLPALLETMRVGGEAPLIRPVFLSMARIQNDLDEVALGTSVDYFCRHYLTTGFQEGIEASLLALGVVGERESVDLLESLVLSTEEGAALMNDVSVAPRTRAYAAYALGLVARNHEDAALRERIGQSLAHVLLEDEFATYELHVACMLSMGLAPARECGEGEHVDGHVCRGIQISSMLAYALDEDREDTLRAHAAVVAAKLSVGADAEYKDTVAFNLLEAIGRNTDESAVFTQGAMLALGHLGDVDDDEIDDDIRRRLEKATKEDGLTGRLAMMSLARVGSRPGSPEARNVGMEPVRSFLMGQLARGRDGRDAWAGMALGVLEFHALQEGLGQSEDVLRALEFGVERRRGDDKLAALSMGLGVVGHQPAREDVLEMLSRSEDPGVRGYAALTLGLLGDRDSRAELRAMLEGSEDEAELYGASLGLRLLGDREVAPALVERLAEAEESEPRRMLASAIGLLADARTIAPLIEMMQDEDLDPEARGAAAAALGSMCDADLASWAAPLANDLHYGALSWTLASPFGDGTGLLDMRF